MHTERVYSYSSKVLWGSPHRILNLAYTTLFISKAIRYITNLNHVKSLKKQPLLKKLKKKHKTTDEGFESDNIL